MGIVEILLESGANANAPLMYGRTPLHYAAALGQEQTARLLLSHGANPLAADHVDQTPYDIARRFGTAEFAAMLHPSEFPQFSTPQYHTPFLFHVEEDSEEDGKEDGKEDGVDDNDATGDPMRLVASKHTLRSSRKMRSLVEFEWKKLVFWRPQSKNDKAVSTDNITSTNTKDSAGATLTPSDQSHGFLGGDLGATLSTEIQIETDMF
jgi:hypothetical protein